MSMLCAPAAAKAAGARSGGLQARRAACFRAAGAGGVRVWRASRFWRGRRTERRVRRIAFYGVRARYRALDPRLSRDDALRGAWLGTLLSVFDFTDFARRVYDDPNRPEVDQEEPRILPAFYGGDLPSTGQGRKFRALVVLQNPLFTYTKRHWQPPCESVEEAIRKHRRIFVSWLPSNPELDELFRHILVSKPSTPEEFFRLVYVTDVWKDAKDTDDMKERKKNREYGRYWRDQLKVEIEGVAVAAEGVVFIGEESRRVGFKFLPDGALYRDFVFPGGWGGHKKLFMDEFKNFVTEGWKVKAMAH